MKKYIVILLLLVCSSLLHAQPWVKMVKDIYKGIEGSRPMYLHEYDNKLYFLADDSTHGHELWISDGTEAGTAMIKDLWPGYPGGTGGPITNANGKMFFLGNTGTPWDNSICESDGTEAGTKKVVDVMLYQGYLTPLNNLLIFNGSYDITSPEELWVCDGTAAGTFPLTSFNMQTYDHLSYNNKVYVTAHEISTLPYTPWVTDGTIAGTYKLKDIIYGREFTGYNGLVYFRGKDDDHGYEIWVSDGTEPGTNLFKDLIPGPTPSLPYSFTEFKDKLFFFTGDNKLWYTDGDPNNIVLVDTGVNGGKMVALKDKIFFTSGDSVLWVSDGTEAGTKVYNKDAFFKQPNGIAVWNEKLFFWGYKRDEAGECIFNLYWTDGESGDVLPVVEKPFTVRQFSGYRQLKVAGNVLYFDAEREDDSTGMELWRIIDFPAGTEDVKVANTETIYPNPATHTFSIINVEKGATVEVYSLTGQLLLKSNETQNIDIGKLPAGMYHVHVLNNGNKTVAILIKE